MIGSPAQTPSQVDRILVVDDLPDNCFLLQTVLESEGYQVEVVDNGQAALARVAAHPPNLILLDVMMPGISGFEVTRRIRQNLALPFIPILLVTGYNEPLPADGFEVGADGWIRKPIDFDQLLDRIQAILLPQASLNQPDHQGAPLDRRSPRRALPKPLLTGTPFKSDNNAGDELQPRNPSADFMQRQVIPK